MDLFSDGVDWDLKIWSNVDSLEASSIGSQVFLRVIKGRMRWNLEG